MGREIERRGQHADRKESLLGHREFGCAFAAINTLVEIRSVFGACTVMLGVLHQRRKDKPIAGMAQRGDETILQLPVTFLRSAGRVYDGAST